MAGVPSPYNSDDPRYPRPPGMAPGQYGMPPANNTKPVLTPTGQTGYQTYTPGNYITGTLPSASTYIPQTPEEKASSLEQQRYTDEQNLNQQRYSDANARASAQGALEQTRYTEQQKIAAQHYADAQKRADAAQAAMQGLLGGLGGVGGGFPAPPTLQGGGAFGSGGGSSQAQTAQLQVPDMGPAEQAVFNRAKDQQGQITRSAMSGLQSSLAGRGLLGGGYEAKGARDIIQQGAGDLGNLTREQAIQHLADAQKMAEAGYTGQITQRGQDISAQTGEQQRALEAWKAQNDQALERYRAQVESTTAQQNAINQQKSLAVQAAQALGSLGRIGY